MYLTLLVFPDEAHHSSAACVNDESSISQRALDPAWFAFRKITRIKVRTQT